MKMPFGKSALLLGVAVVLAPVSASAQAVRVIDPQSTEVLVFGGEVAEEPVVFQYSMKPSSSLTIDVVPTPGSELDPIVTVTDKATGEVLAEDDDGGDGLASRAEVYADEARDIEITVSSFSFFSGEESQGGFELMLRPGVTVPEELASVEFGGLISGTLESDGRDLFTISGEGGELLQVALVADDDALDPLLTLYKGEGVRGEELVSNDDGGEGLNSLLRFVLPESGSYTIAAQAYSGSSGAYTLRVAPKRGHAIQSPQQVLALAERVGGYLGAGYENGSLDPSTITYQLTEDAIAAIRGRPGDVTITMVAAGSEDEFFPSTIDPYLELGFETPLGYASVLSDDDGGEGLNARLIVDLSSLAEDGDWLERLRITASSIGDGGSFELEMVEGVP